MVVSVVSVAAGVPPSVALVRWPEDAAAIEHLRAVGAPRLVLVAAGEDPPAGDDCVEDWVRLPVSDEEVRVRANALAGRAARHLPRPVVNGDGRISFRGVWVAVSDTEEPVIQVLVEAFGEVVDGRLLAHAVDPPLSPNAVRMQIMRIRKRLGPLGLEVRTVRGRGYVLEVAAP